MREKRAYLPPEGFSPGTTTRRWVERLRPLPMRPAFGEAPYAFFISSAGVRNTIRFAMMMVAAMK